YINPDDIDFAIIKTFPKAAVWFKNVTIMGSLPDIPNDTLLKAESIYLLFNAKDIWNKKYVINQIKIKNASLKILLNGLGEANYDIWKTDESIDNTKEKKNTTAFKLSKITLDNFNFTYKNSQRKLKLSSNFKEVIFSGNFSDAAYQLDLNAQGTISFIKSNKKNYLKNKNITIDLSAAVNKNTYSISKAEVALNKLSFSLQGSLTNADTAMPCNIACKGKNIDIQSVLSLLPESFNSKIKDYESNGVFYAEANMEGNLLDYNSLKITSSFGINNATVTYTPLKTKLNNVNFTGTFNKQKYKPELLVLKNISAKQNQNYVSGNLELKNFAALHLSFDAQGKYNLQDLLALVPIDTLASAKGMIDFDLNASLNLYELSSKKHEAGTLKGKVKLNEVELAFKNGKLIQVPEGLVRVENENVFTENLKIIHQTSSLQISGNATNLLNYLFKENQKLYIDADITSPSINVNDFLFKVSETNTDKGSTANKKIVVINKNISANIKLNINKIEFNSFSAKNFVGTLELKNRKLLAKNFSFAAFDGDITLDGFADASDSNFVKVNCATNLVDVDIHKMFSELNNFGQTIVTDKNLKGKGTAQIDFSAIWSNRLECDLSSILAGADIIINKGELIDYTSLESLAKYIELKELKHIKFSTLKTHVDIKNQLITFSKTELSNSALNMDVWGTHTFNNEIDYHIKLLLSEYLAKRPGKSKQMDEELIENENDPELKRCVFLHMTGTVDNPIIKYDRKAMKQKIKQDLKDEKKNLKKLLHEEFGWFKKDTTLNDKKDKSNKQDQKFKVEFNPDSKKKPKEEEDDF
ncbi:MAG TPA: AsmA-like C-terminal region-containing protein, partial [Bacteroidia bacterium]